MAIFWHFFIAILIDLMSEAVGILGIMIASSFSASERMYKKYVRSFYWNSWVKN